MAEVGEIVSQLPGGGLEVRSSGGLVRVSLRAAEAGSAVIELIDSAGIGLVLGDDHFEDFESGKREWTHRVITGPANDWTLTTMRSRSGRFSFWSGVPATDTSDAVLVSPPFDLSSLATSQLEFAHFYDFARCDEFLDGGIVEIRTLPGSPWMVVEPLEGYPAVLTPPCAPPLALKGPMAAYGRSTNDRFVEARFDLSAFSGERVQLRFHVGWDCTNCSVDEGWFIDDVRVTGVSHRISFLDPLDDADGDGLPNGEEVSRGTDVLDPDSDGDRLQDGAETGTGVFVDLDDTGTSPLAADTDGDGFDDGEELRGGAFPTDPESVPEAQVFDFEELLEPGVFALQGTARRASSGVLRLTEATSDQRGSAFLTEPVESTSLDVSFDFRITLPGGSPLLSPGADGIALVIAESATPEILGDGGGGLGFSGLPFRTLAVAFDTWRNSRDVDDNHVELHYHPEGVPPGDSVPVIAQTPLPFRLDDGELYTARVRVRENRVTVTVAPPGSDPITAIDRVVTDLEPFTGFLGFTASTGAAWERHEIDSVTLPFSPLTVDDVEPSAGPSGGGTGATIRGRGFVEGGTSVTFGGSPAAEVEFVDENTLNVVTPAGLAGPVTVQVFVADRTGGRREGFTYTPFIRGIAPPAGLEEGGNVVEIGGLGLAAESAVAFGDLSVSEVVPIDDETLRVMTPPGEGLVSVTVSNSDGIHVRQRAFRYVPSDGDFDGDGLSNADELASRTDPANPDTDDDGLLDSVETNTGVFVDSSDTGTDPLDPDTDDGGTPDGEEIAQGLDPVNVSDEFFQTTLAVLLIDGEGFRWDIIGAGEILEGTNDAFDRGMRLFVGSQRFPSFTFGERSTSGEIVRFGPATLDDLVVTRQIFVPASRGNFARYLETLHNPTDRVVTRIVTINGNLGSDGSTRAVATSSGDRVIDSGDYWFVTDDAADGGGSPTMAFLLSNPSSRLSPREVVLAADDFHYRFEVDIAPGGTAGIIHFVSQNRDSVSARENALRLSELEGRALDVLPPGALRTLINVSIDSDEDGIPDIIEVDAGLDPEDPADAAGDVDGDGLTNVEEFELGTSLTRTDTDGDGFSDSEELAAGLDPTNRDSDGDGLDDNVETGTGVFVDANDTGTDPLDFDTDGGRMGDGLEISQGLDPFDPDDDVVIQVLAWTGNADRNEEYPRTIEALAGLPAGLVITETTTTDSFRLSRDLEGKDVFLLPEQENLRGAFDQGRVFSRAPRPRRSR